MADRNTVRNEVIFNMNTMMSTQHNVNAINDTNEYIVRYFQIKVDTLNLRAPSDICLTYYFHILERSASYLITKANNKHNYTNIIMWISDSGFNEIAYHFQSRWNHKYPTDMIQAVGPSMSEIEQYI